MKNTMTFPEAVNFACLISVAKNRSEKFSMAKKSHILALYNALKKKDAPVSRQYDAKVFINEVEKFKSWLTANPNQKILDTLYGSNITLFDYSKEVIDTHKVIKKATGIHHIVIEKYYDVVMVEDKYYYSSNDGLVELGPENIIIRQSDPTKHSVDNKIVYLNITNDELRKRCGTLHPSRAWYSYEFGANYYYVSDCMVKHWFAMSDDRKEFASEE